MRICIINQDCFGRIDDEHTKTRASGGSDHPDNLIYMCRKHHTEKHAKGLTHMTTKYSQYHKALRDRGWEWVPWIAKWKPPKTCYK